MTITDLESQALNLCLFKWRRFLLYCFVVQSLWIVCNAFIHSPGADIMDSLPLSHSHYEPLHRENREAKACQPVLYENVTHSKYLAATQDTKGLNFGSLVETHYFLEKIGQSYWDQELISVLHQVVNNPLTTLSILEPGRPGTCENGTDGRMLVRETAVQNGCIVATNAGLFNTHTGACLGNIVSDGVLVQDSGGIQNAHFGLTQDGHIFTGYLSEMGLLTEDFTQLVGGVIWLVKDGVSYVDQSLQRECPDTQETGTLERFTSVVSARSAIGHDAEGRVHLVQVNGKTDQKGINLYNLAELLIKMGMVNAINLDGGGSTTSVINGTLVNYPSDRCKNSTYNCERPVTTVVCIHAPYCVPRDCSGHGLCDMGVCQCHDFWHGHDCSKLKCPADCSWHGTCTEAGCKCKPGWQGNNCSLPCQFGFYGKNCSTPCFCQNGGSCSPITGKCLCAPGYSGNYCQSACPVGYFGEGCSQVCFCKDSCFCDPISGNCTNPSQIDSEFIKAGHCIAMMEIKERELVPSSKDQISLWLTTVLCLSILSVSSLLLNALLSLALVRLRLKHQGELKRAVRLAVKRALRRAVRGNARRNSENDDEDEDDPDDAEGQFIEEPLSSSSDNGQQPNQQASRELIVNTRPLRQGKNLTLRKFFPLKSVKWGNNRSPAKAAPLIELNKGETNTEQLFPLLTQSRNGGVGVYRQESASSDEDVEHLFIAPQRKNETSLGSR